MNILVVEDDFTCRMVLQRLLSGYGQCDVAVDGEEGVAAFRMALEADAHYDLVCLDIMMPNMDGHEVLKKIRAMEEAAGIYGLNGSKVIMVTAMGDAKTIMQAFNEQCEGYIVKPVQQDKLVEQLKKLGLIEH